MKTDNPRTHGFRVNRWVLTIKTATHGHTDLGLIGGFPLRSLNNKEAYPLNMLLIKDRFDYPNPPTDRIYIGIPSVGMFFDDISGLKVQKKRSTQNKEDFIGTEIRYSGVVFFSGVYIGKGC